MFTTRQMVLASALLLVGCGEDSPEYRRAYDTAYQTAFGNARRTTYQATYPVAFGQARNATYRHRKAALLDAGRFKYNRVVLFAVAVAGAATGFGLQFALVLFLRRHGWLQGDLDRLLLPAHRARLDISSVIRAHASGGPYS